MRFDYGDVVCVVTPLMTNTMGLKGLMGTVKYLKGDGNYGIEFNQSVGGHNCDNHVPEDRGWYVSARDIQRMEPLAVAFKRMWEKEWAPKAKKRLIPYHKEPIVLIED